MIKIFWTMNLNTLKRSFVLTKTPANLKISRPIIQSRRLLCASSKWDKTKLDSLVQNNKVVVFMKGVPAQPLCGFSNAVMQVLRMHGVDEFDSHNILDDEELRSEMKVYSNWPTFPQVYVGGELLGGCDIILQLHQNGELIDELSKVGIRSALLDKEKKK